MTFPVNRQTLLWRSQTAPLCSDLGSPPGTAPRAPCAGLMDPLCVMVPRRHYYCHLTDLETKTQRVEVIRPKYHNRKGRGWASPPGWVTPKLLTLKRNWYIVSYVLLTFIFLLLCDLRYSPALRNAHVRAYMCVYVCGGWGECRGDGGLEKGLNRNGHL